MFEDGVDVLENFVTQLQNYHIRYCSSYAEECDTIVFEDSEHVPHECWPASDTHINVTIPMTIHEAIEFALGNAYITYKKHSNIISNIY